MNSTEISRITVCSQAIHRRFLRADGNELPHYEPKVSAIQVKMSLSALTR